MSNLCEHRATPGSRQFESSSTPTAVTPSPTKLGFEKIPDFDHKLAKKNVSVILVYFDHIETQLQKFSFLSSKLSFQLNPVRSCEVLASLFSTGELDLGRRVHAGWTQENHVATAETDVLCLLHQRKCFLCVKFEAHALANGSSNFALNVRDYRSAQKMCVQCTHPVRRFWSKLTVCNNSCIKRMLHGVVKKSREIICLKKSEIWRKKNAFAITQKRCIGSVHFAFG